VDRLKWAFFSLGLRAGVASTLFVLLVGFVIAGSETASVEAIAALYYPLFRAMLLLSYFGILFGVLLFAWKRCGIDYTAILGVDGGRTNVHAVVRASTSLMGLNFSAFVLYWLALLRIVPHAHAWPASALLLTLAYLFWPLDQEQRMRRRRECPSRPEEDPRPQAVRPHGGVERRRPACRLRALRRAGPARRPRPHDLRVQLRRRHPDVDAQALHRPAAGGSTAAGVRSRRALSQTLPKTAAAGSYASLGQSRTISQLFHISAPHLDLPQTSCIYLSGEALRSGDWDPQRRAFERGLSVCTGDTPAYRHAFALFSVLPFVLRALQCGRQLRDATAAGSPEWRRHALNIAKYAASLTVQVLSLIASPETPSSGRSLWLAASCVSSLFAFLWDVLVDWGLGPQPVRRAVRYAIGEPVYRGAANSGAAFWLRPVRALPTLWYFVGICVDLVARLTWAVYISPHQRVVQANVTLLLGAIELSRRASWGLFRLEWEQIRRKSVEVHADDARRQPLLPGARRGPSTTHDLISAALSQNIRSMTTRASAGGMHVK